MNYRDKLTEAFNKIAKERQTRDEVSVLLAVGDVLEQAMGAEGETLEDLGVEDLEKRVKAKGLEPKGTGAGGNVVKKDLVKALKKGK